jgi:UrcA family protein
MLRNALLPLALTLACVAGTAQAEPQRLRYGDLNLATEAGTAALDQRIDQLAERMCADTRWLDPRTPLIIKRKAAASCSEAVRSEALAKLAKQRAKTSLARK